MQSRIRIGFARRVIQAFPKSSDLPVADHSGGVVLLEKPAAREREVLALLAKGHVQKEIADQFNNSQTLGKKLANRGFGDLSHCIAGEFFHQGKTLWDFVNRQARLAPVSQG